MGVMKSLSSRCAFLLGFIFGFCTLYFFLRQVWFERSFTAHRGAKTSGAETGTSAREGSGSSKDWRVEGAALINLRHPHEKGDTLVTLTIGQGFLVNIVFS